MKIMGSPSNRWGCLVPSTGMMCHSQCRGMSSGCNGSSSSLRTVWDCSPYKGNLHFPRRSERTGILCKERLARGQRVATRSQAVSEAQDTGEVPRVRT